MNKFKLEERINELIKEIADLQEERRLLEQQLGERNCPFRVGDRVRDNKGKIFQIFKINYNSWSADGYDLKGATIRKDNTPSLRINTLYKWSGNWEKV